METMYKVRDSLADKIKKKERSDLMFLLVLGIIVIIMSVTVVLYTAVFFNVVVDGPSMNNTLTTGDVLVASKNKGVERGSLIVIDGEKPNGKGGYDWLIKRAIAVEGDTVYIANGYVYLNGEKLDEDYVKTKGVTDPIDSAWATPKTLNENEVFYLGDNRTNSSDSRMYGTCKEEQIVGVVENWSLSVRWLNGFLYDLGSIFRR